MTDNTGGGAGKSQIDLAVEMDAYDNLPPELRRALRWHTFNVAAYQVQDALDAGCEPDELIYRISRSRPQ